MPLLLIWLIPNIYSTGLLTAVIVLNKLEICCISAGHDIELYNNRIISSGLLSDGSRVSASSGGSNIWDFNNDIPKGTFYNNFAHDNTLAVVSGNGNRQDWWFPDCASGKCTNNIPLPNPITQATEQAEYQTWLNKIASNNVAIGPK